jgi:hypothetical protein
MPVSFHKTDIYHPQLEQSAIISDRLREINSLVETLIGLDPMAAARFQAYSWLLHHPENFPAADFLA